MLKRFAPVFAACLFAVTLVLAGCGGAATSTTTTTTTTPVTTGSSTALIRGADVGWLTQLESLGYSYVDETNTQLSALQILKNHGVNTIRIRTFVNPTITAGSLGVGDNNQAGSIALAQLANSMGFKIIIDFHYSDTWADPGDQTIPAAWSSDTYAELQTDVYNYTYNFMEALAADGIYPAYVQVGNEINSGMLWPLGSVGSTTVNGNNFTNITGLINSGYSAVKAASSSSLVVIHIAGISNLSDFEWFFDGLKAAGANYDVIGASYYDGPTNISTVATNMNTLSARYSKPVMICEIGYSVSDPTTGSDDVKATLQALYAVPSSLGLGAVYWEPEAPDNATTSSYSMGAATVVSGDELKFTSVIDQFLVPLGGNNQVIDSDFASGLNGWQITPTTTAAYAATYTQADGTTNELVFSSTSAYNTTVWQTSTALPSGTYTLTAQVENSGGQSSATMYASPTGGSQSAVSLPTASSWTTVTISGITVSDGSLTLGFAINANAGNWTKIESVTLVEN